MKSFPAIHLILSAVFAGAAQAQIPATVTDTRMIFERQDGKPDTTIGHTVSSRLGTRAEHSGRFPSTVTPSFPSNIEIMSFADSEMTMTFIDTTRKIYTVMQPSKLMGFAMGASGMKMESSDDVSTLDSLGAGPLINGHSTLHFRTHNSSKMTMMIMGDTSRMTQSVTADLYLAPDINPGEYDAETVTASMHAVQGMMPTGMQSMISGAAKNQAVLAKHGMALKTVIEMTQTSAGGSKTQHQTIEIIGIQKTTVPASTFLPPTGYKKVGLMDFVQVP